MLKVVGRFCSVDSQGGPVSSAQIDPREQVVEFSSGYVDLSAFASVYTVFG